MSSPVTDGSQRMRTMEVSHVTLYVVPAQRMLHLVSAFHITMRHCCNFYV